jgi:di/tricarboxylate transporter
MADFFRRYPLATIIGWAASALVLLVTLQASGVLTGQAAQWVATAVVLLQVVLTWYAKRHVTPVADPRDNAGRRLAPQRNGQPGGGW